MWEDLLTNYSEPGDVIDSDRKEYEESGYRVSISQIEEVGMNQFFPVREALQAELKRIIDAHDLDIACLMVTDVTRNDSLLLIEAPEEVLRKVHYPRRKEKLYKLDGIVSRKKQLFPWLSTLLGELARDPERD